MTHTHVRRLRVERLEDRTTPAVIVPSGDLSEGNAANWTTFASDGQPASVTNDSTYVVDGNSSLKFATQSGFDTGVIHTPGAGNVWNVSGFSQLAFWIYAINDTPIGFQGNQPIVVLNSATGKYTYTPQNQQTTNYDWRRLHIPLSGDSEWVRTSTGTPNLTAVTSLEIHQDTWDSGFTVYYDGVRFDARSVSDPPIPGPPPPPGVIGGRVEPKILLYVFDPIMQNHSNQRLHQVYNWGDPVSLTSDAIADLTTSSHGMYAPTVVETVIADEHPYFVDGFQHTDASFDTAWNSNPRDFHNSQFDYERFIIEHDLADRVDAGEIDEVWIYAPPIAGLWESAMAGNGAYWINGPTQPGGERAFPIMGLNYERGIAEAIHSFGHRAESSVDHAYSGLSGDSNNAWRRFTRIDKNSPGQGGVGNVHFPVNGQSDYDYANPIVVSSSADAWLSYPDLSAPPRSFNYTEWSPSGVDPHREYLNWWYAHIPHVRGTGPDDRLANWWRYIGDVNTYKNPIKADFSGADGTGKAWITGLNAGETVTGMRTIGAGFIIDGAAGRADLYVDGKYIATDTLAPFTFTLDSFSFTSGSHIAEVRIYDVRVDTEMISAPITFSIGAPSPVIATTGATANTVSLTWTDTTLNETGFIVERATNSAFTVGVGSKSVGANVTSTTLAGLASATTYYFRVRAVNGGSTLTTSNVVTRKTHGIPATPSSLVAIDATASTISLTWTDNTGVETGYILERATDSGFVSGLVTILLPPNSTGYAPAGLPSGTEFFFRVRAINGAGESFNSNVISRKTHGVPGAPSNLVATDATGNSITVNWMDTSGVETGYILQRSTNASFSANLVTVNLAANSTTYTATGLPSATEFFFRVRAVNGAGNSAFSDTISRKTHGIPAAPTNLTSPSRTANSVSLMWTDNTGVETGYILEWSTHSNFSSITGSQSLAPNTTIYTVTGLPSATTFYFRVRAINAAGASPNSEVVTKITAGIPATPSNLAASNITASSLRLTWNDNSGVETGYLIERATNSNFTANRIVQLVEANTTSWTIAGLNSNTQFYFRVRAINDAGTSLFSNIVTVLTGL